MALDLKRVRKSARRVASFLKANPKRPASEAVHQLRTGVRTLESTLAALGLDAKGKGLPRGLKKIRKAAGKVRDMDVLTGHALTIDHRGEQDCLVRLLEYLGARRQKDAKKLSRFIHPALRKHVKRSFRRAEKLLAAPRTDPAHDSAVVSATSEAIQASSELTRPRRLAKNNLHEYRLELKKFRDLLRLSDQTDRSDLLKHLDEVKDAIGDWHDWVELVGIAEKSLKHDRCKLVPRIKTIAAAKYEHALSLSDKFARRYLAAKPARGKRRAKGDSVSPALKAATSIAEP